MKHWIRPVLAVAPFVLAATTAHAGAKPWACTNAEEICASAGEASNRCQTQKKMFAGKCEEYWGAPDASSTSASATPTRAPDRESFRVLEEQQQRALALEQQRTRETEAILAQQRAAAERFAAQTNAYFLENEARRREELHEAEQRRLAEAQRGTGAAGALLATAQQRQANAAAPRYSAPARRSHFTHYARYENTGNGLKYVVYIANDGEVKLRCSVTVRGLIWGNEFGGMSAQGGLQSDYSTTGSATVYPGRTEGALGFTKVVPNSGRYELQCRNDD